MSSDWNVWRDKAARIAREAGVIIRRAHEGVGTREFDTKSASIDLVTATDRASEAYISDALAKRFPGHGLLGEEGATRDADDGAPTWIVDPLDGTTNFAHGIPIFAVSMGATLDGEVVAGVVYDVMRDEMFAAARGEGTTLNDKPVHTSERKTLAESVACSGFPYDRRERADFYLAYWKALMTRTHGVRRCGAAALDLAWVAAGRYDVFWEFGLAPWDVAAASLLITEAGGVVTATDGSPHDLFGARIAAANPHVHGELIEVLRGVG